jgi:hypothetical protein
MQRREATERVPYHRSSALNSYRVEERADEACCEGRSIIWGLNATVVAGKIYCVDEVVPRQAGQYLRPLPRTRAHTVQ